MPSKFGGTRSRDFFKSPLRISKTFEKFGVCFAVLFDEDLLHSLWEPTHWDIQKAGSEEHRTKNEGHRPSFSFSPLPKPQAGMGPRG